MINGVNKEEKFNFIYDCEIKNREDPSNSTENAYIASN